MVDTAQALPMDSGRLPVVGLLQATFRTFAHAPAFFLGFALVATLPGLVHLAVFGPPNGFDAGMAVVTLLNFLLLFVVEGALCLGAFRVAEGYMPAFREGFDLGLKRFLPLLGATLLTGIAVYVGFMLLIVPGMIVACVLAVGIPVCALEGLGPIESLRRSAFLTKGQRWRIFFAYLVLFVPIILIGLLNGLVVMRSGAATFGYVLNAVLNLFWTAIAAIFSTLMYIELRRLKELSGVATLFE